MKVAILIIVFMMTTLAHGGDIVDRFKQQAIDRPIAQTPLNSYQETEIKLMTQIADSIKIIANYIKKLENEEIRLNENNNR